MLDNQCGPAWARTKDLLIMRNEQSVFIRFHLETKCLIFLQLQLLIFIFGFKHFHKKAQLVVLMLYLKNQNYERKCKNCM